MTNIFEGKYSRPFTFAKVICTETFKHCKFMNIIMAPPLSMRNSVGSLALCLNSYLIEYI